MKELIVFIAGMGFVEGFVKPLSIFLFRGTLDMLPEMFDRLDPLMPEFISKLTASEMREKIRETMDLIAGERGKTLSEKEKEILFREFTERFDPVIAASKTPVLAEKVISQGKTNKF